jgi:hypothetical protein
VRCKREFGEPEDKAHENFTEPNSRIMRRAGGRFDASANGRATVDEAAHIIVAAELDNTAPHATGRLSMMQAM